MKFVTPEVEVIKFEQVDVIAASNTGGDEDIPLPDEEL